MTTPKRQALTDFLQHSVCVGQSAIGPIGYSPLPVNLVQASLTQVNKLKLADPKVVFDASIIKNVKNCHNPTFVPGKPSENYLAKIAPFPAECDRPGQGPCGDDVGTFNDNPGGTGTKTPSGAPAAGAAPGAGPAAGPGAGAPAVDTDGDGVPDAPAAAGGAPVVGADGSTTGTTSDGITTVATTLDPDARSGPPKVLAALVLGLFLGVLVVPPVVGRLAGTRRRSR
ncbi:hypothetical protein G5V59_06200 [Nocardioides sp. W3-2-3]|uniref:hypothetical protein n=1 Tax=Nocardioides convexus TaxID=2712224 RepID=UPI002418AB50|nr:hypothetical protein [Nocardioides convexus]NGZ99969.1 hypothetical protein [Nocardioides convexus]